MATVKLGAYIVRRVALTIPVLVGVTIITFTLAWWANEGHMERGYLTDKMTAEQRESIVQQYGFDEPFLTQYLSYLKRLVTLDLGVSHAQNDRPILDVYKEFFPATIELTLVAVVIAVVGGVFLGTLSAVRKDHPVDHATRFLALAGVSVPIFWLGLLLKFAFATPYPVELFTSAGFLAKAFVFFVTVMLPTLAGLYLAENFAIDAHSWKRLAIHLVVFLIGVVALFLVGWTFLALVVLWVGGVNYATVVALRLTKQKHVSRRAWRLIPVVVLAISLAIALSPFATRGIEAVFAAVPDAPLGGRFSNDLVANPGEHPSLTEGPTRILLVDTLLARDWVAFNDVLSHLVLPAIALGYFSLAIITRMMRSSMLETLSLDFVRTARAKGLDEPQVIERHARRNALIPVATVVGLTFGSLLSGAVLTETIFQWPGLGRWSTLAIGASDVNSTMGFVLLVVLIYLLANLVVDIAYSLLDPRVRLA